MSATSQSITDARRRQALLRRAQRLSRNMDTVFRVPGTDIRFGVDALIGLIPGAGDLAGLAVSLYIVWLAKRIGADAGALARMCGNIAIDALVGAVPLLGDIFDVAFKANVRNVRMIESMLTEQNTPPP